jgi:hypothetical protein
MRQSTKTNTKIKPSPSSSSRELLDFAISEAAYQQQIIDLARLCGYLCYHTHNSQHSPAGFPDLVLCKPGKRLLIFEVKRQRGVVSDTQRQWIAWLRTTGTYARVMRPSDWSLVTRLLTSDDLQEIEELDGEVAI